MATVTMTLSGGDSFAAELSGGDSFAAELSGGDSLYATVGEVSEVVTSDHAELTHLDFASSNHTGFVGSSQSIPDSFINAL